MPESSATLPSRWGRTPPLDLQDGSILGSEAGSGLLDLNPKWPLQVGSKLGELLPSMAVGSLVADSLTVGVQYACGI